MKNPSHPIRRHSSPSSRPDLSACESGNALIELAFSLPLFAVLMLGTAELGNLAWASVQLNNAARAGAQYASQSHISAANTSQIGIAAQLEAPQFITAPATQVTASQACYCVSSGTSGPKDPGCTTTTPASCAPGVIQVTVQVNIQAPVTTFVHYPGLPAGYTVNAQATAGVTQ